jgi:hypothetical protein
MSATPSRGAVLCRITFKLSRKHSWANRVPVDATLQELLPDERVVAEDEIVPDVKHGQIEFLGYQNDMWWVRGDKHDEAAEFLDSHCEYSRLRIEATLSRFDGF